MDGEGGDHDHGAGEEGADGGGGAGDKDVADGGAGGYDVGTASGSSAVATGDGSSRGERTTANASVGAAATMGEKREASKDMAYSHLNAKGFLNVRCDESYTKCDSSGPFPLKAHSKV